MLGNRKNLRPVRMYRLLPFVGSYIEMSFFCDTAVFRMYRRVLSILAGAFDHILFVTGLTGVIAINAIVAAHKYPYQINFHIFCFRFVEIVGLWDVESHFCHHLAFRKSPIVSDQLQQKGSGAFLVKRTKNQKRNKSNA